MNISTFERTILFNVYCLPLQLKLYQNKITLDVVIDRFYCVQSTQSFIKWNFTLAKLSASILAITIDEPSQNILLVGYVYAKAMLF